MKINKNTVKSVSAVASKLLTKVAESAVHAAVFAFVNNKVTDWMDTLKGKNSKKVRVDENDLSTNSDSSAGGASQNNNSGRCC